MRTPIMEPPFDPTKMKLVFTDNFAVMGNKPIDPKEIVRTNLGPHYLTGYQCYSCADCRYNIHNFFTQRLCY